ncbi:MAG: MFS transporter [Acidobacteriia bacterium]|nr:MFS transporter [Terriglobia bacterium]
MNRPLFILLACVFLIFVGFGITLPVLPFYTERLALAEGTSEAVAAIHIAFLTSIYPLMQFLFAPLWGRWSDRFGRKPLLLVGITGFALTQALFGISTGLWMLYGARAIGGLLAAATLPAVAAYVVDMTKETERARGMALQGTAVSLGVVVGPALGGLLARNGLSFVMSYGGFSIDRFSIPFLAAAGLGVLTLFAAAVLVPESLLSSPEPSSLGREAARIFWLGTPRSPSRLLVLAFAAQFGLAVFETTFALHAQNMLGYGAFQVGLAFMICGLVMSVFQIAAVSYLSKRVNEMHQIAVGLGLMGASLGLLVLVRRTPVVMATVGTLALGMSLISPNLAALVSKNASAHSGAALGEQSASNSLGQVTGTLLGGFLFAWAMRLDYALTGAMLVGFGVFAGLNKWPQGVFRAKR